MWRRRQRLQLATEYLDHEKAEEKRKDSPLQWLEGAHPAHTLISNFWSPEAREKSSGVLSHQGCGPLSWQPWETDRHCFFFFLLFICSDIQQMSIRSVHYISQLLAILGIQKYPQAHIQSPCICKFLFLHYNLSVWNPEEQQPLVPLFSSCLSIATSGLILLAILNHEFLSLGLDIRW